MEESFFKQQGTYEEKRCACYLRYKIYQEWCVMYLRAREDSISKLPESLLCQILSYLPTKDIVRTSVLSKRWKRVCFFVPGLDLASSEFPDYNAFVSFMDRFQDFCREEKSILHKLKLSIAKNVDDPPCVTRWIDFVATHKLKHLDVECLVNRNFLEVIPQSLYTCDTLVYLRLHRVSLAEFESVSLHCLKTMRLEHNVYASDASLESLISSSPVLEDLSIVRMVSDNVKVLRVHSQTLASFHINYMLGEDDDYVSVFEIEGTGVMIDAPRLKYLKFEDNISDSIIITNSRSLAKVNVAYIFNDNNTDDVLDLPKQNMVRNFFTSISGVSEMKISLSTIEFIECSMEYDLLPKFCNVSTLKVTFSLSVPDMIPTFLESFPNLKSLVLVLDCYPWTYITDVKFSSVSVPRCLVSSLESVEIKHFDGTPAKMEVARYFLENSLVLKKLVLRLKFSKVEEGFCMLRDLLAFPRRSSTCQVVVS